MTPLPQLRMNSFLLPKVPNLVSVRRLVLAAGRGSGLALELWRILENPRWFGAWLWIQEEEHRIFNVVNVWYRVKRRSLASVFFLHQRLSIKPSWRNSAQSRFQMIICTMVQHGCSKQTFQLVFVLSRNKVEENVILWSKIQLLKICPVCLSVCLSFYLSLSVSVCLSLSLSAPAETHNCCDIYHRLQQYEP